MPLYRGNVQYAAAGIQAQTQRLNVRSTVRVPDGDIGDDALPQTYCCETVAPSKLSGQPMTVSRRFMKWWLLGVVLVFLIPVGQRVSTRATYSKEISAIQKETRQMTSDNAYLIEQVHAARDAVRVCYRAMHELKMVAAESMEPIYLVVVPTLANGFTGDLENSSLQNAQISGSR